MKVIVGYAFQDEALIRDVADKLAQRRLDPVLIGLRGTDSLMGQMLDVPLLATDRVVVALSSHSVGARWLRQEVLSGVLIEYAQRYHFDEQFVSTILLRACEVPLWLRDRVYANFVTKDFDTACEGLYASLVARTPMQPTRQPENAIFRTYDVAPVGQGEHAQVVEFGVAMTRTKGLHVEIDAGVPYTHTKDWFGPPNSPSVPQRPGGPFFNSSLRRQPPIYTRKFVEPEVTPAQSYYLYLEADEPLHIQPRVFADSHGRVIT